MEERNLRVLEFPKIREMLAAHAKSEVGNQRALALEPADTLGEVMTLQTQTEEARSVIAYQGGNPIQYFTDIREYLKLASIGGTLTMKALLDVAEMLRAARGLKSALVTDREDTPVLTEMGRMITTNRSLEEEIFNAILSEEEMSDHASPELYDIRRHIKTINDRMRDKLNSYVRTPSLSKYLQDTVITMRNGRYVLQVKAECRQNVPGLVHDQSQTGSTLFIEPMAVVEMGNDLKQYYTKEKQEIDRILSEFSARVAPDSEAIAATLDLMAEIDVIFAKACLAREMDAVQPKLNDEGRIRIVSGRHPLIPRDRVVPSNLWMGEDFTTLVVTGPNTGGKTVTLKTVGLFSLMAQAGLQIPAQYGSELSVFDEIYADIGDEQSIEQSLSTFSSHMTNIVHILENVTSRSLVLFDELGAGTDPTEGAALAMSILQHLLNIHVNTLATTHYSELKAFALSTRGVENASVEFDVETLRPTYKLSIGIPGKSNAFEISRKLGLPDFIIKSASERLSQDQVRFEDVIANAEYHRQIAEKERQLAEQAHIETQKIMKEAEKMKRDLETQREEMMRKAKDDARAVLKKAQRESETIITELKKSRAGQILKEHELNAMRAHLQGEIDDTAEKLPGVQEEFIAPETVKIGDNVEVVSLGTKAVVVSEPDSKKEVMVQAGAMKMKMPLKNLKLLEPEKKKNSTASVSVAPRQVHMEADVRGMSLEEAIAQVDLYIDGAVMNAQKLISIIHGKGTGVLRSGIQSHLKRHPQVKSFRLGVYGEGEDGVTVVTLK